MPPLDAASPFPTTLRLTGEPLIGRQSELARAAALLGHTTRLLSVTGPGGVGKTRFATEIAAQHLRDAGRAVVYVPLASVTDHDLVMVSIARAAGLPTGDIHDVAKIVAENLARVPVLLVLDNLEQIIAVAPRVGALLADCPTLQIITTTRIALRIHGEIELTLEPLAVPERESSADIALIESVAMLGQAVRRFDPAFRIDTHNAGPVAEVCRRVEGLPLAIELAAARLRLLTPGELADLLGHRLDVLGSNLRDAPPHQRTMRATIDWSYRLLADDDRRMLRTLAVFAGGFSADAVAAVTCDDIAVVLDCLEQLVGHHLVRVGTGADGLRRFDLFDSIREFAVEQLTTAGEDALVREAHARWVRLVVEESATQLVEAEQADALARLDREIDNIRAALSWSIAYGHHRDDGLRIAAALWRYWWIRGRLTEGRATLDAMIGAVERPPDAHLAAAYQAAASLADEQSDSHAAEVLLGHALEIYSTLGDPIGIADCWNSLGLAARELGDLDRSEALHLDALDVFVKRGERRKIVVALSALASLAYVRGDLSTAAARTQQVIDTSRESGDRLSAGQMLSNLGVIHLAAGDTDGAVRCHEEAIVIARELADAYGVANAIFNLGEALLATGDVEMAESRFIEAGELYQQMDQVLRAAQAISWRGRCAARAGDYRRADELWLRSLMMSAGVGGTSGVADCLERIAGSATAAGVFDVAVKLFTFAALLREREGSVAAEEADSIERDRMLARSGFDVDTLDELDAEVVGWSIDDAARAAAECVDLLRSTPDRTAINARTALAKRVGLSMRELDVVDHLIGRHTDREIAEALFISTRTVTTHVSAILRKLGLRSRREVAAAVNQLGYTAD